MWKKSKNTTKCNLNLKLSQSNELWGFAPIESLIREFLYVLWGTAVTWAIYAMLSVQIYMLHICLSFYFFYQPLRFPRLDEDRFDESIDASGSAKGLPRDPIPSTCYPLSTNYDLFFHPLYCTLASTTLYLFVYLKKNANVFILEEEPTRIMSE